MTTETPTPRIGYVLKMYPRFSETFIVNEILAHEAAGLAIEIFSLRPPSDGRFHEMLAQVQAQACYLPAGDPKAAGFWAEMDAAARSLPGLWEGLEAARGEDARDVYQAMVLARMARERGITHLHAHFATVATTVARLAARFAGLPYSFTAHAKDIYHDSVAPEDLGRKLGDAAAVITVSDFNLLHLRANYGSAAARAIRIYNGLDLWRFPFNAPAKREPRIVAVGRLVEKKGFADLIVACAVLAGRGRPFTCAIIGAGELEPELRARIADHGLQERVRLLGPQPQGEVVRWVREAAVLAAPCVIGTDGNRDGLPTVLLEAMALGTPCVSTDVTGIPEILEDGKTGLLVPQHDPGRLAHAIERLLYEPELRIRLAEKARLLVEERFDIHQNAARVREAFSAEPAAPSPQRAQVRAA